MNPVLLKPESETGAQIIVQGRRIGSAGAREFQTKKRELMPAVLDSFARLKADADLVLVEGAGSASEINLRANDIANFGFARAADVPVILIGDIDRGGVIASLVGTKHVIDAGDAAMIRGFIVNKMRGDASLFADGMAAIAQHDGMGAARARAVLRRRPKASSRRRARPSRSLHIVARHYAGQTAYRGAAAAAHLELRRSRSAAKRTERHRRADRAAARAIPRDADLILLPGSKATIDDLAALRAEGWDIDIKAHVRRGGRVLGLCGGYQMLGKRISDPNGIEGPAASSRGPRASRCRDRVRHRKNVGGRRRQPVAIRRRIQRLRNARRRDIRPRYRATSRNVRRRARTTARRLPMAASRAVTSTASSHPTMRAPRFFRNSARSLRAKATSRASMPCSTGSPSTSRGTSTSSACSRSQNDGGDQKCRHHDRPGHAREPQRIANILRRRFAPAVTHVGVVDEDAVHSSSAR